MEKKWTPGPWVTGIDSDVYAEGECDTWIAVGPQSYDAVALVVNEHIKGDAEVSINAHLIAAAPDLYEALVEMCNWHGITDKSRAALAKARGEQ
jgi:hypothetical protein